jgi:hypothetical protein
MTKKLNETQIRYYRSACGQGMTRQDAREVVGKLLRLKTDELRREAVGVLAGEIVKRNKTKRKKRS